MANGIDEITEKEENEPPGLDYLCSSFFDQQVIEPLGNGSNLLQVKQQNFTLRVETDMEACRELFEQFSPKKTLFELWDFRYAFYLGEKHQPVFLIFERNGQSLGLLPLWHDKTRDELRWFGSWWQEGNTFWVKDKSLIPIIFSLFPQKILLNSILVTPRKAKQLGLLADEPRFLLSLDQYPTLDSFMEKLSRKKRYNLRRDQRLTLAKGPKAIVNRFEDLERLFELSIKRFSKRDGSPFESEDRKKTFREIVNLAGEYETRMVSIEIEGEVVGVDLIAIYRGVHYCLQGAYDLEKYPGLGNYANLLIIEDAIVLGAKAVDFLEEANGWKDDWFEPIPCFQFKGLNLQRS